MSDPTPQTKRGFMPFKLKQFELDLAELHVLLKKAKSPMTVLQILSVLGCSKQAVYFRLETLKARGVKLKTTKVREGEHGPYSKAYSLP